MRQFPARRALERGRRPARGHQLVWRGWKSKVWCLCPQSQALPCPAACHSQLQPKGNLLVLLREAPLPLGQKWSPPQCREKKDHCLPHCFIGNVFIPSKNSFTSQKMGHENNTTQTRLRMSYKILDRNFSTRSRSWKTRKDRNWHRPEETRGAGQLSQYCGGGTTGKTGEAEEV